MNWLTRYWQGLQHAARAFVTGPAVVERVDMVWGHDTERFSPPEYGDYIATSNGVYTCVRLRANLLTSLPLKLYKVTASGQKEVTTGEAQALLTKVNPFWTLNRLLDMTEQSLCLWGKAFWFLSRGSKTGTPKEIWWARPDRVKVIPDPVNYIKGYIYEPMNGNPSQFFEPHEVVWLRYPNPLDEFDGLSPIAAARIAADTAAAAMQSNRNIFKNGVNLSGIISPKAGGPQFTKEQREEIERALSRRFTGVDKAHRMGVFAYDMQFQSVSMSPKDAEFLGSLSWALEDIARAFGVPLDMVGGQRTYANVEGSDRAIWTRTLVPEARFIASEITEQLLPFFPEADLAEFDLSDVEPLHEAESERWTREYQQIQSGAITINEWRKEQGFSGVKWGDVFWAPSTLQPIDSADLPEPKQAPALPALPASVSASDGEDEEDGGNTLPPGERSRRTRIATYGSDEHKRQWEARQKQIEPYERLFADEMTALFRRQRQAIVASLNAERSARSIGEIVRNPFSKARWVKAFRSAIRTLVQRIVREFGEAAVVGLGAKGGFDDTDPEVIKRIERQAQEAAVQINDTTWEAVREALEAAEANNESAAEMAERVREEMNKRIRDAESVIAPTEVTEAANSGTVLGGKQSGVAGKKRWNSQGDSRVRGSHRDAHGQEVGLDEDFTVGSGKGPAPGQISSADENFGCRCWVEMVADKDAGEPRAVAANGNGHYEREALERLAKVFEVVR